MHKHFSSKGFDEYVAWQTEDRKTLKRINVLIKDIESNEPAKGVGKPERLKYIDAWSRRIDDVNRFTYTVEENSIIIYSCKGHYDD